MKAEFNKISEQILEVYVKPLCKHPETGEQCDYDYSDATGIVDMVLHSGLIQDLLYQFWQRTSDACPLEAAEAEKQEKEFSEWVKDIEIFPS